MSQHIHLSLYSIVSGVHTVPYRSICMADNNLAVTDMECQLYGTNAIRAVGAASHYLYPFYIVLLI